MSGFAPRSRPLDPRAARSALRYSVFGASFILAAACVGLADGEGPAIVRVEEDWVVEINTPDPDGHTPQIINTMSIGPTLEWSHALFELNHSTMPSYNAGGMQLQLWRGDDFVGYSSPPQDALLSVTGEQVKYTLSMKVNDGRVEFEVKNGQSDTWGSFGTGNVKVSRQTIFTSAWGYDPAVSVANSRVAYAAHRVRKFALKEIRYYSASGLVSTDSTERVVHEHLGEN